MKSIMDILVDSASEPSWRKDAEFFKEKTIEFHSETQFYAFTVTVDHKVKYDNHYIYRMSPQKAIMAMDSMLLRMFNNMVYIWNYEWTKAGVIHLHGLIAHPGIKIYNSLVESTIRTQISKFGKMNMNKHAIAPVRNIEGAIDYILKEYTQLDTLRYSSHFAK